MTYFSYTEQYSNQLGGINDCLSWKLQRSSTSRSSHCKIRWIG